MYEETDLRHLDERINIEDNSQYIKKYEHIRAKLKELLGDDAVYIEHVGTTAVNDIFAYPVIDVAIAASTEKLRDRICEKLLSEHGFTECKSKNDEILIRKGTLEKPSYYIHLTLAQSNFFRTMLRFRDELKIKPKRRDAYENIHSYAKLEYRDDLDKYHNAKTSFIRATAKQNSVENYDDEIHIEKTERYRVNKSSEIVEKICGYILYAGIAQLLVRMFLGLIIVLVFTAEAVPLIIGCGLLSILSTIFMIYLLIRERTDSGIVLKRIMFIVFGGVLIADAIINLIVTLNG